MTSARNLIQRVAAGESPVKVVEDTVQMPGSVRTEGQPTPKFNVGDHVKVKKVPSHFGNQDWQGTIGRVGTQPGRKWDAQAGEWTYLVNLGTSGANRWWPESNLERK